MSGMPDPRIHHDEFEQRWESLRIMMLENNLDLLITYSNDRAVFGNAHARWISDFPTHLEPVFTVSFRTGDTIIASGPESLEYIKLKSKVKDIYVLKEFTHQEEVYAIDNIRSMYEIISERENPEKIKRVGVAGLDIIDHAAYVAIRNSLPDAELVDVEYKVCLLRARKTKGEIEVLRNAYRIADLAFKAAVSAIKPGKTEMEICAVADDVMKRNGAENTGIDTMIASGPYCAVAVSRPTFRVIEKQDIVRVAVIPRYEGYHATIGRPVFVGNVDPDTKKIYGILCEARDACVERIRIGVDGSDAEGAGRKVLMDAGYQYTYSGIHSIGVKEFESPIFGPGVEGKIFDQMALSIEIPLFEQSWGGLHMEDGCLVTDKGAELFLNTRDYIAI